MKILLTKVLLQKTGSEIVMHESKPVRSMLFPTCSILDGELWVELVSAPPGLSNPTNKYRTVASASKAHGSALLSVQVHQSMAILLDAVSRKVV